MSGTKVKICGITNELDLQAAVDLGVDAIGFNFYPGSPRFIAPTLAARLRKLLPPHIWAVGVFVNESRELIEETVSISGIDTLQFHGDEPGSMLLGWEALRVVKAVRLSAETAKEPLARKFSAADYILFDKFSAQSFGGTGEQIGEDILSRPEIVPLIARGFLAGGITPENAAEMVSRYHPFGIDAASGIEVRPGKKDHDRMKMLIQAVRAA